jgi:hypothetical protein
MAIADDRGYADLGVAGDVEIGSHAVGAIVDVVVFDSGGYCGRVLGWDLSGISEEVALMMAGIATMVIDEKMGEGTCTEIEVWDLEHDHQWRFVRAHAVGVIPRVQRILDAVDAAIAES